MAGRIPEHPEQLLADGVGDPGGTERQNLTFGGIRIIDLDVQVDLLRSPRIREIRWRVLR